MQHFNSNFDQLKDIELEPIDKDDIIKVTTNLMKN
jgi:hypothetical protein